MVTIFYFLDGSIILDGMRQSLSLVHGLESYTGFGNSAGVRLTLVAFDGAWGLHKEDVIVHK